jgi:hypothetical protein
MKDEIVKKTKRTRLRFETKKFSTVQRLALDEVADALANDLVDIVDREIPLHGRDYDCAAARLTNSPEALRRVGESFIYGAIRKKKQLTKLYSENPPWFLFWEEEKRMKDEIVKKTTFNLSDSR